MQWIPCQNMYVKVYCFQTSEGKEMATAQNGSSVHLLTASNEMGPQFHHVIDLHLSNVYISTSHTPFFSIKFDVFSFLPNCYDGLSICDPLLFTL